METLVTYMGIAAGLIFLFLVLSNGDKAVSLTNSLSGANIGAIKALQGR